MLRYSDRYGITKYACVLYVQVTTEEEFDSVVQGIEDIVQEHAGADPSDFLQYLQVCLHH